MYPIVLKNSRTVSTQTHSLPPLDLSHISSINNCESYICNTTKRRRFPFSRPLLASSSLFTNLFRQSPTTNFHSQEGSTKSSMSLNQHSSAASSSCPIRSQYPVHHYSSNVFRQIESEMDNILVNDHRPRASSSSSALIRRTYHQTNSSPSHWNRPLRRRQQHQSRSSYFLRNQNSSYTYRPNQTVTSTTNTNSSDSSSVFHRFNPRYYSIISRQQQSQSERLRDERIVAANERKALKVLLIIFCVFVTLWTPFFICTFISAICDQCRERISPTIWFSITWLGYSSSMANPFIYTIFSDVFRRAFTNIILCRSNDSVFSRQMSTKLSYQKGPVVNQTNQQQLSHKRNQNNEYSGNSTPLNYPAPIIENDATIYINRCVSDSFR
jgi:hypothetical protein